LARGHKILSKIKEKISVLILTYNQAEFIESALASVVGQKSDQYDLEIILTDDGSSDGTVEIVERFIEKSPMPIKFVANQHQGVSAIARNLLSMINISDGDFIAFLAGDDYYSEDRFRLQLESFGNNPNLKISYSDGVNCIDGKFGQRCHSAETVSMMLEGNTNKVHRHLTSQTPVLFIQGVLAKANFLRKIQPFDIDLIADDWVFNIKVFQSLQSEGVEFSFEPSVCFVRNIHGENTSRNLIVHYERIRQVANRYCRNSRLITSKFIGSAILSALKKRDQKELAFFTRKILSYPEASVWLTRSIVASAISKFSR